MYLILNKYINNQLNPSPNPNISLNKNKNTNLNKNKRTPVTHHYLVKYHPLEYQKNPFHNVQVYQCYQFKLNKKYYLTNY